LPREELAAAVDMSSLKIVAFEIGMLARNSPERARLRGVFELAGVELDDDGVRSMADASSGGGALRARR
jgi:hypothetical protein